MKKGLCEGVSCEQAQTTKNIAIKQKIDNILILILFQ